MTHSPQVDPAFVQAPEHRPKAAISAADGVPLIDLSPLFSDRENNTYPATLLAEVEAACRDWGFFQVIKLEYRSLKRFRTPFSSLL
jgi:non-haem dioxygenase in morphine synthesis N-terminal